MVSIDDSLNEAAAGVPRGIPGGVSDLVRRLQGRRLGALTQPRALALAGGLAAAVLGVGLSSGWIAGQADAALSSSDEVTLASGGASGGAGLTAAGVPVQACGRIEEIVHTACGYKQHDHDVDGIRQCVAYELKYTMWSAYGCR